MIYRAAFWLMLPLTALQGLWLRRKATRLPGAAGKRTGRTGRDRNLEGQTREGQKRRIQLLAIGDSIIDGVGIEHIDNALPVRFAQALADEKGSAVHWRVEGASGRDIGGLISRIESLGGVTRPDLVLISIGVNDVTGLSSTRHWRRKLLELMNRLGKKWPRARLLFVGLPPMGLFPLPPQPLRFSLGLRAATLDRIAADVIRGFPNAEHVPTRINPVEHGFCPDGFHPSAESCTLWARELAVIESRRESR